jgi:hypothetical protein
MPRVPAERIIGTVPLAAALGIALTIAVSAPGAAELPLLDLSPIRSRTRK